MSDVWSSGQPCLVTRRGGHSLGMQSAASRDLYAEGGALKIENWKMNGSNIAGQGKRQN